MSEWTVGNAREALNEQGHFVLDPPVGAYPGDSVITAESAQAYALAYVRTYGGGVLAQEMHGAPIDTGELEVDQARPPYFVRSPYGGVFEGTRPAID